MSWYSFLIDTYILQWPLSKKDVNKTIFLLNMQLLFAEMNHLMGSDRVCSTHLAISN